MSNIVLCGDWWSDTQTAVKKDISAIASLPASLIGGAKQAAHAVIEIPKDVTGVATGAVKAVGDTGQAIGKSIPELGLAVAAAAGAYWYFFLRKKSK